MPFPLCEFNFSYSLWQLTKTVTFFNTNYHKICAAYHTFKASEALQYMYYFWTQNQTSTFFTKLFDQKHFCIHLRYARNVCYVLKLTTSDYSIRKNDYHVCSDCASLTGFKTKTTIPVRNLFLIYCVSYFRPVPVPVSSAHFKYVANFLGAVIVYYLVSLYSRFPGLLKSFPHQKGNAPRLKRGFMNGKKDEPENEVNFCSFGARKLSIDYNYVH